jgi:rsbT antagonist protein RsbS
VGTGWAEDGVGSGPIATRVGPALVVTLPRELDEATLRALRGDVLDTLRRSRSRALVLEATGLELIDAEDFRQLTLVARTATLLGVRPLLVGLSPGIVAYLVEAGVDTRGVRAYATLDDALVALGAIRAHVDDDATAVVGDDGDPGEGGSGA